MTAAATAPDAAKTPLLGEASSLHNVRQPGEMVLTSPSASMIWVVLDLVLLIVGDLIPSNLLTEARE